MMSESIQRINEVDLTATSVWRDLSRVVSAHVLMLRDAGIIADSATGLTLSPLDGIAQSDPPKGDLTDLVVAFDARVDSLVPPAALGVATLGRGRSDTASTVARLIARTVLINLLRATGELRDILVKLGGVHAATTMPFFGPHQTPQPTTFGHFLGGLIGPLARADMSIEAALDLVNVCPMGAVAGASTSLPISRERTAALLGFAGVVENTLDAVAATDHLSDAATAAGTVATAIRRFLDELLVWLRTDPDSLRLSDEWTATDAAMPGLRAPLGIERLIAHARAVESGADRARQIGRQADYAAVGSLLDPLLNETFAAVAGATVVTRSAARLLTGGLDLNLAYLANRAGKGFTTASDLTSLLMNEEQLDPVAAAGIAALTISRARDEGVEISGITSAMIDGAALMTLGRELGVEFELISRYLAPRRYLERRTVTGGPAPQAVRASLDRARRRLDADRTRREALEERLQAAERERTRLIAEAIDAKPEF